VELIVITSERMLEHEEAAIDRLFAGGLATLHLRKPEATAHALQEMLEKINCRYHDRIVLHDHFALASLYKLKGVHLNRRNPDPPADRGLTVSKSCHALNELEASERYDYVFLSPVFDSISKSGYRKAFTEKELIAARDNRLICPKVYALGGVSRKEIPQAARYGFGGVAVLGALWEGFERNGSEERLLELFGELRDECHNY
jgi:thiamine-phosphate pyrophosphorylase